MTDKKSPVTLDDFDKKILPKISLMMDGKLLNLEEKFEDLKEEVKLLPTKEEHFNKMDKVVGELQKLRGEVSITGDHYKKTNKRIDLIDKHLGLDTTTVF